MRKIVTFAMVLFGMTALALTAQAGPGGCGESASHQTVMTEPSPPQTPAPDKSGS